MANYSRYKELPNYEVVPLRSDVIGVAACQMNRNIRGVDPKNPKKKHMENLDNMIYLCDVASQRAYTAAIGAKKLDLIVFPEFCMTGIDSKWTRDDWQKVSIEVPGEETEIIGKKAKELDCYIAFQAHIKDPKDWPDHYFNASLIIDPNGEVIHKHWKAYRPAAGGFEWATTVHDVLDRFLEMYGPEAVWPVCRTPIGNLATYVCSEGFAPETARMFAFQGAEIICRCWGGGGSPIQNFGKGRIQFRADCGNSLVYGVMANANNGGSMIVDPFGRIMTELLDNRETAIYDRIPIAAFRSEHSRPYVRTELYVLGYEQNPGQYPPNMYSDYGVPANSEEAVKLCNQHARFWSPWYANR